MKKWYFYLDKDTNLVITIRDRKDSIENSYCVEVLLDSSILLPSTFDLATNLLTVLRAKRDLLLSSSLWRNERHLSQTTLAKTLTEAEYVSWQNYWQLLRDLPQVTVLDGIDLSTLNSVFPIIPTI